MSSNRGRARRGNLDPTDGDIEDMNRRASQASAKARALKAAAEGGKPPVRPGQWSMDAYRRAHEAEMPKPPAAKPPARGRSPIEEFAPVNDAQRADLQKRVPGPIKPKAPVAEPAYKGPPKLTKTPEGWSAAAKSLQAPKIRSTNAVGAIAALATPYAVEKLKQAKGSLGDKTGGEGSFKANVASGASKAEGISRPPSLAETINKNVRSSSQAGLENFSGIKKAISKPMAKIPLKP